MNSIASLKTFLEIPYDELENINLLAKQKRNNGTSEAEFKKEYIAYLKKEAAIKAVTLCFSDIEGRFHMLDYDKKHFLKDTDNLTFDGSSIRGFSALSESDLRLSPEWASFRWLPTDLFGSGKVIMFADVLDSEHHRYAADPRGMLKAYCRQLLTNKQLEAFAAPEIEGFLVEGIDAEQHFDEKNGFQLISTGGYYHSLPKDSLRQFIDRSAEAQRAMAFENEKDHPEVAPSQFELNFHYGRAVEICDQIQLYKLVCRQVATDMGMTATFLPKPISGINGSGMHMNFSVQKNGKNIFYDKRGKNQLSNFAYDFISRLLNHASELCLVFNSSVNAYRRLDPNFEAPNQIKISPTDRGAMVRIPMANEQSTRIEVRSVAPDANPYLVLYSILKTGLEGEKLVIDEAKRPRLRFLAGTIYEALKLFKASEFISKILGKDNQEKYAHYKQLAADRSPKDLGRRVKNGEVLFHHEVTNQVLWNEF